MSDDDDSTGTPLQQLPSGLAGLDAILCGGFFRGGVYLLHAKPGSGKTILGNQICFGHVAGGGRALFVTLLTESHARLMAQLQEFAFFDANAVGATLSYVSGYQALEKDKLKGLLVFLRQAVRDHKPSLLVIDGIVTAGSMAESEIETKKFVKELQVFGELMGCTTLLLTGPSEGSEHYALRTMVDGLVELHIEPVGMDAVRTIEVTKSRGGRILMGRHLFEITDAGLSIYPRTEACRGKTAERRDPARSTPASLGVKGLDKMLGGGLHADSVTMVLGAPGSGKTLLGLSFLAAGATDGEPGLHFGFFETPSDLRRKAESNGIPLANAEAKGLVVLQRHSPLDALADALAEQVFAAVRERGVRRLFLDGTGAFKDTLVYTGRSTRFFEAFFNELRSLGVVTLLVDETPTLGEIELPERGLTAMLDNVICLRHVEAHAQRHKLVSVIKMREGSGDHSLHEYSIGPRGFVVAATSESAEATLSGLVRAHTVPRPVAARSSAKAGKGRRGR